LGARELVRLLGTEQPQGPFEGPARRPELVDQLVASAGLQPIGGEEAALESLRSGHLWIVGQSLAAVANLARSSRFRRNCRPRAAPGSIAPHSALFARGHVTECRSSRAWD